MTEHDTTEIRDIAFKDGRPSVVGARCRRCTAIQFPARPRCTGCGAAERDLEELLFDRRATVESYSEIHTPHPGFEPPYTVGYVRLSPGDIRVFAPLFDVPVDAVAVGSSVEIAVETLADGAQTWGATLTEGA